MIQEQSMPKPLRLGESAVTLRTQADSYIPFISDQTYRDRILRRPWVSYRGARPLHRTTLTLDRSKPKLDYLTLYKHYYQGNPQLQGVRRPPTCPSMFTSQWEIGEDRSQTFNTINGDMYPPKTGESVQSMRSIQVENRINNTHGRKMMDVTDMDTGPSYVTSYRTVHDSLGTSRGRGVPHSRKKPPQFNIISGEALVQRTATSEPPNYRLRSGNRVLSEQRRRPNIYQTFQLY